MDIDNDRLAAAMFKTKKTVVNMSDNEDLLGDDCDQSLADYNLGNEEEDQLLADDYESGPPQVPSPIATFVEPIEAPAPVFTTPEQFPPPAPQRKQYHLQPDTAERVVPSITVEVPNQLERSTYAPYEPPVAYVPEHAVPAAIPATPMEAPQLVPSEMAVPLPNGEMGGPRERFVCERPAGAQRTPQIRDIPDSLDKVAIPRPGARGRTSWRNPQFARHSQYRRNNMHRGNFNHRPSFPPPQKIRPNPPQIRPDIRPNPPQIRPDIRPDLPLPIRADLPPNIPEIRPDLPADMPLHPDIPHPDLPPEIRPDIRPDLPPELPLRPDLPIRPEFHPEMRLDLMDMDRPLPPEVPIMPNMPMEPPFRHMERPPFPFRPQFRPNMDEPRPFNPNIRPGFEPFPYQRPFRPFPPIREVAPNMNHLPQVTIRHAVPNMGMVPKQEVRMLPVQLPPNLPPGGLQGKKVLINPHFKGNFQPPVEGLTMPAYIPTRIQKSPPLSPTLESKFGPVKNIDDAAERFIAEQRNALARAANRKFPPRSPRRSPQRFVENTTIEISNELARPPRRRSPDDDLLRRQEEFINANRAGLRRRMRSPSPPRRSPSPRPERARPRPDTARQPPDEDSEYRRRMREQEALRERVMRAKEARRRRTAQQALAHAQPANRERERTNKEQEKDKEKEPPKKEETKSEPSSTQPDRPDTTRTSPEKVEKDMEKVEKVERDRSPVGKEEAEVNSTCEALTPPPASPRALTPPLPPQRTQDKEDKRTDSDDDLDLILGDIDGILSDDDDSGRFKEKAKKPEPPKAKPPVDLRSKLPPKTTEKRPPRQKIVFHEEKQEKKRKEKSPTRKTVVTSSIKTEDAVTKKTAKTKEKVETPVKDSKTRSRIIFDKKETEKDKVKEDAPKPQFSNRRVILQRKITQQTDTKSVFTRIEVKSDPTKPNPGIFSRAVRTAIGNEKTRIVIKKQDEPEIEYESDSEVDEENLLEDEVGNTAVVDNLPHGMTDTRLKTLAGSDVQTLNLDKEERSAKIIFKTTVAAENFKKKFNNKMVAASRLTVTIR